MCSMLREFFMKRITCIVKPRARKEHVTETAPGEFEVAVTVAPIEGRANKAVIAALSRFFNCAPTTITLIKGQKGKRKIFEIL